MSAVAIDTAPSLPQRVIERRLAEFVDRDDEMRQFQSVLDSDRTPVMMVWGATGIGKTSLLLRMVHECALRKVRKAEIVWSDTRPHDYMAVMRKIRDDLGVEPFKAFTDLINFFTDAEYHPKLQVNVNVQGEIAVGAGMQVAQASVGDVAGVVIKDSMFVVQRTDLAIPAEARREQLTARFLEGLGAFSQSSQVVVFLDAVEKMSEVTYKWFWEQVVARLELLPNVRFVLCGQKPPPDDPDLRMFIASAELKPLGVQDIALYIGKKAPHVAEAVRLELAKMILAPTGGRPTEVANWVDLYLKTSAAS
jgi:hypothetical protein